MTTIDPIVKESFVEAVCLLGDFNAHKGEFFCKKILSFCAEQGWIYEDMAKLGIDPDTHTYRSEMSDSR